MLHDRLRSERGAAAVEFGLVLPILLVLLLGIIDFGRAYHAQITLTHAAREGARAFAVNGDTAGVTGVVTGAATALTGVAVSYPNGSTCEPPSLVSPGSPAEVRVTLDFDPIFFPFLDVDLDATGVMRCTG